MKLIYFFTLLGILVSTSAEAKKAAKSEGLVSSDYMIAGSQTEQIKWTQGTKDDIAELTSLINCSVRPDKKECPSICQQKKFTPAMLDGVKIGDKSVAQFIYDKKKENTVRFEDYLASYKFHVENLKTMFSALNDKATCEAEYKKNAENFNGLPWKYEYQSVIDVTEANSRLRGVNSAESNAMWELEAKFAKESADCESFWNWTNSYECRQKVEKKYQEPFKTLDHKIETRKFCEGLMANKAAVAQRIQSRLDHDTKQMEQALKEQALTMNADEIQRNFGSFTSNLEQDDAYKNFVYASSLQAILNNCIPAKNPSECAQKNSAKLEKSMKDRSPQALQKLLADSPELREFHQGLDSFNRNLKSLAKGSLSDRFTKEYPCLKNQAANLTEAPSKKRSSAIPPIESQPSRGGTR